MLILIKIQKEFHYLTKLLQTIHGIKLKSKLVKKLRSKLINITDKAIFADLIETKLSGMLHYKEISYQENIEDLKKFKKK